MWDSLQNLLSRTANKYNFQASLEAIKICQEYRNLAPKLLPENALKSTFPKSYHDNTLTIGVLNSVWAGQIQMKKHLIQKEINQKFGAEKIKKIKIEISERMPGETQPPESEARSS